MESDNFQIAFGSYDKSPQSYYLSDTSPLKSAVFLALKLGKPLLITGEPGTGKTQLAYWAAWYLSTKTDPNIVSFLPDPFVFHTKSNSASRDLFYHYDAISHFQDKEGKKDVADFISLAAMGQAICQTLGREVLLSQYGLEGIRNIDTILPDPHSSVLLIDEIDKATRDFPNDLLNEIESSKFSIPEMEKEIPRSTDRKTRNLIILTSNSERSLPDAFLRRCLFYNVAFPTDSELMSIVLQRLHPFLTEIGNQSEMDFREHYQRAIRLFHVIREKASIKPPSTSELLDWLKVLHMENLIRNLVDEKDMEYMPANHKRTLQLSLYTLLKTKEDLEEIETLLKLQ